ncbi:MAG: hypothetical protein IKJ03_01670 [Mycoplasmataceae bacterium]|nr:hypothetical protein [Mycoplasmataceae bacterium]
MPKKKTIYIDCSAIQRAENKKLKSNEEILMDFYEEYKRKRDFIEQIDKQQTKSLLKHIAEAVKGLREYEEKNKRKDI